MEYSWFHELIHHEIWKAKEKWLVEKCQKIEEMQERCHTFNMRKVIKRMTGSRRLQIPGWLKDNIGNIWLHMKDKVTRWKEYAVKLFEDDRFEMLEEEPTVSGEKVEIEEVMQVIQNLENS